jgi:hypothetical protein
MNWSRVCYFLLVVIVIIYTLLDAVADSLVKIATNIHGTRAVQKLVEVIQTDLEFSIVIESLKNHVVMMIQDLNGYLAK